MKVVCATLMTLIVGLSVSQEVSAKGKTTRIEITAPSLAKPLTISAHDVVSQFSVWTGPGVSGFSASEATHAGAFIDWHSGAIANTPPRNLRTYRVSFYCDSPRSQADHLAYVVTYADDPASGRGYIYLPGRGEEDYVRNVGTIVHAVEGHWFYASDAWQRLVKPLLGSRPRLYK
jgi:hypothetical protein